MVEKATSDVEMYSVLIRRVDMVIRCNVCMHLTDTVWLDTEPQATHSSLKTRSLLPTTTSTTPRTPKAPITGATGDVCTTVLVAWP